MSAGTAGPGHRALLQLVVDAALDAVIVMNAGGLVVHWNQQAEVIFGWTRAEALGQPLAALVIPPRYRAAHTEGLRRFLETGQGPVLNRRVELVAARRDGRELPVELTVTPFTLDGEIAFTGFVRDITERKRAEERLARQLLEAQLLHQATTLAATSPSLEDALRRCVEIVCRMIGWPIGHVYMPAAHGEELVPTTIWHLAEDGAHAAFRAVTERTRLPRGVGLPGRVWRSGEPEWLEDLPAHEGFARAHLLPELGLRTAFAFPVTAGDETLAILEFFTDEAVPPDPRLLLLVRSIGEQVGRLIERREGRGWPARARGALPHPRRHRPGLDLGVRPRQGLHLRQQALARVHRPEAGAGARLRLGRGGAPRGPRAVPEDLRGGLRGPAAV